MRKRNVKRVYMPSYCCNSMLQPFLNQHKLEILFYQVDVKDGKLCYEIEFDNDVDLFFALNYFGIDESIDPFIERFKQMGAVIIEDITHRLLSNHSHNKHSDYLVASLRKWFAIPTGGLLVAKDGFISLRPDKDSSELVSKQIEGMKLKTRYLRGNRNILKQD